MQAKAPNCMPQTLISHNDGTQMSSFISHPPQSFSEALTLHSPWPCSLSAQS